MMEMKIPHLGNALVDQVACLGAGHLGLPVLVEQ